MDSNSDEQTELLRSIWNHLKELNQSLGRRIDGVRDETKGLRDETKGLRDETKGLGDRIDGVRDEVRETNVRLDALRDDVNTRFDKLTVRVDNVERSLGERLDHLSLDVRAMKTAAQGTFELLVKEDARQENDLAMVRERIARIEHHVGLPAYLR
jgi:predicted  nucleic acid-binding Zn-ribbon protein